MSEVPTVIANRAHLPGLNLPGEYDVEFDTETEEVTVLSGPQRGKIFKPHAEVIDAMRRAARSGQTINESVESYTEIEEK